MSSKPVNKSNVEETLKLKKQLKKEKHISKSYLNQLKYLQDLYKSGVISGYEYENEKKKLLIK